MHKIKFHSFLLSVIILLQACGPEKTSENHTEASKTEISSKFLADLPIAISNNALASAQVGSAKRLYSFMGLESGKEWSDVSTKVFRYSSGQWKRIRDVSLSQGRLASVAVTAQSYIYLLGGYTVSEDHSEVSTPEVLRFDPYTEEYDRVADIPISSDDAVALVYQDRYIYLISGWHDKGNINLVQVYDALKNEWKQATQFPGSAVFGHAGGIVDNKMVVCDGVKINYPNASAGIEARREFLMSDECYIGRIDETDPYKIHWTVLPKHPGAARYRVAAIGDDVSQKVIFVGGSDNPYNYNGIGYNSDTSKPVSSVFAYSFVTGLWESLGETNFPTMDHRGLLKFENQFVTVGGMDSEQNVLTKTQAISFPSK